MRRIAPGCTTRILSVGIPHPATSVTGQEQIRSSCGRAEYGSE